LPGERFHLTVVPHAKTTSLASFAVPVRLKGALNSPRIGFDAGEAIVGTVGNIVKVPVGVLADIFGANAAHQKTSPCFQVLAGGKTPVLTKHTHSAGPSQNNKASNPVDAVKNIGNALQGLFGR